MPSSLDLPPEPLAAVQSTQKCLVKMQTPAGSYKTLVDIIDVRRAVVDISLKDEVLSMFNPTNGPRQLPTLLLYDEKGLQLFEEITYLDEYYLTNYEIEVLKRATAEIAKHIPSESMVIELGSGNLRKVCLLLQALDDSGKKVEYYALDLSRQELERTLAQLPPLKHVSCHGLLGTYDDGREWLKQPANAARSKCILHLGSSIGNFDRHEAAQFLKSFADVLRPSDKMLIGVDACCDPAKVYHAYNDREGLTHRFILNGLAHANQILGDNAFDLQDWKVIGEYVYDEEGGRHQAFLAPVRDVVVFGAVIHPHDRIKVEQSLKYSKTESEKLWSYAGLAEVDQWYHGDEYGLHMLERKNMSLSLLPSIYAETSLPGIADWESLWAVWDLVTIGMLPHAELQSKPIKLRNACIFYLGHIPTFLDIQLTKKTLQPPTEPAYYYNIFERGIDPDVDNPENCHAHSEIPDEWPPVDQILAFQKRVRSRLSSLYKDGAEKISRDLGRAIWVGYEHEAMHLETLLYMMLQSDKTLPPPISSRPDFGKLAVKAKDARVPSRWYNIPAQTISIGLNDPEGGVDITKPYGWDNEKPQRVYDVPGFQAMNRAITNEEYAQYMYHRGVATVPVSWSSAEVSLGKANGVHAITNSEPTGYSNGISKEHTNGKLNGHANNKISVPSEFLQGKSVRTVYGLVPLKDALDWPVFASYNELSECAAWFGGRIPTFEEARSIYTWSEAIEKKEAERQLGKTVPAVNGHLVNDGVEETPPPQGSQTTVKNSDLELFTDLDGANVAFQHWHPVAVTGSDRLAGQSGLGGVWEWTSSVLEKHEGFEPMPLYPAYTADFFDGKHNIVLGGSWATIPRIAGRKSFVNWYQRNYPYAWVGARLVRDLPN